MTCIAGLVHKGKVYIGGDCAGVSGYDLMIRNDKKVFRNGDFIMGFTSSFRMGQLLQYKFHPPTLFSVDGSPKEIFKYMVTDFIDGVRQCLKDGGYASKVNEEESGGYFLVGYKDRLFCIADDYQIAESVDGMMAVGCADTIALGSLYTTSGLDMEPEKRIELALKAAERYSAGVRGPFNIIST